MSFRVILVPAAVTLSLQSIPLSADAALERMKANRIDGVNIRDAEETKGSSNR